MFNRPVNEENRRHNDFFTVKGVTLGQMDDSIQSSIHLGQEAWRLASTRAYFTPSRAIGLELGPLAASVWGLDTALSFAHAPYGRKMTSGVSSVGGHVASYASYALLRALIPVPIVGAILGGAAAIGIDQPARRYFEPKVERALGLLHSGEKLRRLEFASPGWEDSEPAWTMRQRAAQELGRSLLNARQYLGREALLMHQ